MIDFEHDGRLATPSEACREYAWNYGADRPNRAWILTDFDTWEPNPHYSGPPVPHPEFDFIESPSHPDDCDCSICYPDEVDVTDDPRMYPGEEVNSNDDDVLF